MEKITVPKKSKSQHQEERFNFLIGFIGTNRTGKTSVAKKIAETWIANRPESNVIVFDPQGKFEDIANMFINLNDKDWAKSVIENKNSLLILDDYRMLVRKNTGSEIANFEDLLYLRAEYNIDIIYICHAPGLLHNILTYLTTHYYIFYTQSTDGGFQRKIPNYNLCIGASNLVNKYVNNFGKGIKRPTVEGGNDGIFKPPYVIVTNDKDEIDAINMDRTLRSKIETPYGINSKIKS